jgi:hypothetical protein
VADETTGDPKDETAPETSPESAEAFAEEAFADDAEGQDPVLIEVQEVRLRTQASWALLPKQVFTLLFANILFFVGCLADWSRAVPGDPWNPLIVTNGLDHIRGSVIFALAIYGFWTCVFNIWHRQMKVWPFLLAAVLGLWVGIGTLTQKLNSDEMDRAIANLAAKSHSFLDKATYRLGVVAPGPWLLTLGGIVVLIVLIRGVMSGAAAAKASGRRR